MKKHVTLLIFGKVQGVFFRDWTCEIARKFQVTGYVRNEADGSVYIEAEGDSFLLDEFVRFCHQGPKFSKVQGVRVIDGKVIGYEHFTVHYV